MEYPKIPDHIAAYAAAVYMISEHDWRGVAHVVAAVGLGAFDAADLCEAAGSWAVEHCAPEVLAKRPSVARPGRRAVS